MAIFQVLYMSRHPLHPVHTQHAPVAVLHWGTLVIEEQAAGADYTQTHREQRYLCHMSWMNEWMNEWMMHLYSALLCIVVHPKRFTIMWGGGSLLNHHQCTVSTWMMQRLPQDNGTSALTTHQLQVERRESQSQSSGWELLGGHDWQGPVVGIWPGHRGCTLLFTRSAMGFLMTTESQDFGLTSHLKDGAFFTV